MKCGRCGYSDNGSGDWAHACGPVAIQRALVVNERIRELAEQAGLEYNFDPMLWLKHEKFAELIVRECAALAKSKSEHIQSMETDDRGDQAQIHSLAWQFEEFGYKIKKHFGVEE